MGERRWWAWLWGRTEGQRKRQIDAARRPIRYAILGLAFGGITGVYAATVDGLSPGGAIAMGAVLGVLFGPALVLWLRWKHRADV